MRRSGTGEDGQKKPAFLSACGGSRRRQTRFLLKSAFLEIRPSAPLAVPPVLFDEKIYIRCIGGTSSTPGRWILSWMGSMAGKKAGRKNINKIRNQKFKIRNSYV
jgi:hypothetical protein